MIRPDLGSGLPGELDPDLFVRQYKVPPKDLGVQVQVTGVINQGEVVSQDCARKPRPRRPQGLRAEDVAKYCISRSICDLGNWTSAVRSSSLGRRPYKEYTRK